MAYRELGMWEILEVLRRLHRGEPRTGVQRGTGHSRATVRRYLRLARKLGWDPSGPEPDEALATAVAQRVRPGPRREAPSDIERLLAPWDARLRAWLTPEDGSRGLRLSKVRTLLTRQGVAVPYSSLHRYAVVHLGFHDHRRVTVRVADVAPGELAEVDFGRLGVVPDPATNRRRVVYALIVTLVHSRHCYVHVTPSQRLADVLEGLEDAWESFAGVPQRVVVDNLKAAITKADRYDPIVQRTFAEYAHYRGFVIDAALPRHAKGKPHVERNVPYVRENFFRGEPWQDRDHVQREAIRWCLEIAGQRVHGTTRQRPLAVFEAVERAALQPLGKPRFDPPQWAECRVHPDHHIQFAKALYSVPTRYVGEEVWVRGDRQLVRVYARGALVKTHPRQPVGGRHTDYTDYPPERAPYAMRDPERLIRDGQTQGEHVGTFLTQLLSGPFPWAHLRQAQRLLRLAGKYGAARVDAACRRALAFDLLHVGRVEAILRAALDPPPTGSGRLVPLPPPRFLRPAGSFSHTPPPKEEPPDGDQPRA